MVILILTLVPLFITLYMCIFTRYGFVGVEWKVDTGATTDNSDTVAYGTFEDFLHQMSKREWHREIQFPESYFSPVSGMVEYNRDRVHAGIFKFDGVGMIFTYGEHRKVARWLKEHSLKSANNKLVLKEWV